MNPFQSLIQKQGTALVTGASGGIGEAIARRLAAEGVSLILSARSADKLEALARELKGNRSPRVEVLPADLGSREGPSELAAALIQRGLTVDLLVNNAGMGVHGRFARSEWGREKAQLDLNVMALTELTHALVPSMVQRGFGAVLNVSSTASLQPVPYMAVYGATKAFVTSFSEALAVELEGTGVTVHVVLPGNTETPFHGKVGEQDGRVGAPRTPEQVAETALRLLASGKPFAIDGPSNRLLAILPRILPRRVAAKVTGNLMRKGI